MKDKVDNTDKCKTTKVEEKQPKTKKFSKRNRKFDKKEEQKFTNFSGNDVAWWKKYPQLMDTVAKLSWKYIPGLRAYSPNRYANYYPVTGMAVAFTPVPGKATDATSPVNTIFRSLWIEMHKQFRGLGAYEQSDLAVILLCVANFFAQIAEAERAYGLIHTYSAQNRALPYQYLEAAGFSYALQVSIAESLADYRAKINNLILRAKQLLIPRGMTALYHWISLCANVYKDGEADNAQFIVFKPTHHYKYNPLTNSGSAILMTNSSIPEQHTTYQSYLRALETNLQALLSDQDVTQVCADLLAFYGNENVEYLSYIPEAFTVLPVKDDNILLKLHNAGGVLGHAINGGGPVEPTYTKLSNVYSAGVDADLPTSVTSGNDIIIYQENNNLICRMIASHDNNYNIVKGVKGTETAYIIGRDTRGTPNLNAFCSPLENLVLDIWNDSPTSDELIEACLWANPVGEFNMDSADGTKSYFAHEILTFATEIICEVTVVAAKKGAPNQLAEFMFMQGFGNNVSILLLASIIDNQNTSNASMGLMYASKIDWAPLSYPYLSTSHTAGSGNGYFISTQLEPFGDTTNYKWVSFADIQPIQDCAVLSGFTVDKVAILQ